jgi:hypothetical protein
MPLTLVLRWLLTGLPELLILVPINYFTGALAKAYENLWASG